ncbi:hypothetical protein O3P69_001669 [Scylla paramamosain]|uniref:HECT-type E3 ubiquitin transferase n=2 Tax=Scylla paramamosain TaxID=85552 RepID=A0AAW0UYR0_SCYPA
MDAVGSLVAARQITAPFLALCLTCVAQRSARSPVGEVIPWSTSPCRATCMHLTRGSEGSWAPRLHTAGNYLKGYTETVFASVCAWNSSLTLAGLHKHTHGLDYRLAEDCVAQIGRIARETIQEVAKSHKRPLIHYRANPNVSKRPQVRTGIQNVAKSLPSHPPSQDALRCYVLPLYKDFTDPKQTAKLQTPYAEGVLKLDKEMAEVFKTSVPLCLPLRLLSLVHGLNFQAGCRVGRLNYDDFYIPEIAEKIDIRNDYLNWMNSRLHPMSRRESPILFCEYPFLFDPQAKTLLLRCDATRQGECFPDHPVIRTFWEVFHKLSLEQKKLFLKFLTGTDRVPILGMKALKLMIQSTADDSFLPVAHTCITQLDLPKYNTKEKLKYKLLQAVQQSEGFGLV